ncbi:UNKNOWN [Stylonychia lemnae]|uniref:Uncharacterized protein n=1 Tax=Stylonychia lemnae TaxID=5949 RepID=A0A078BFC6_STYLE|nr:UNKNOWN [Stylonychia lemnae]|eukprot:CDW91847.1 UNKNOWN [Stylonychia lemnae]
MKEKIRTIAEKITKQKRNKNKLIINNKVKNLLDKFRIQKSSDTQSMSTLNSTNFNEMSLSRSPTIIQSQNSSKLKSALTNQNNVYQVQKAQTTCNSPLKLYHHQKSLFHNPTENCMFGTQDQADPRLYQPPRYKFSDKVEIKGFKFNLVQTETESSRNSFRKSVKLFHDPNKL